MLKVISEGFSFLPLKNVAKLDLTRKPKTEKVSQKQIQRESFIPKNYKKKKNKKTKKGLIFLV